MTKRSCHLRIQRVLSLTAMIVLMGGLAPTASAAKPDPKDISDSGRGQTMRKEASSRFGAKGFDVPASELRVWEIADGEYLVGEFLPTSGGGDHEFSYDVSSGLADPLEGLTAAVDPMLTAAAAYWSRVSGGCFARISNSSGYLDSCYRIYKLINDGDGNRDYYGLHHFATCGPFGNSDIFDCWLHGQRAGGSAMAWDDWDPRSDQDAGNCSSLNIGIEHGVVLSWSHQRCEAWDITKYEEAGRFKNQWKCNCIPPWGVTGDREVAYAVTVSVNQAGSVQWTLSAGFAAI